MDYLRIPSQVTLDNIKQREYSLSPSMYRSTIIPNKNVRLVRSLLDPARPFDKGVEPGSKWYMSNSTHHFVRTKALQEYSYLLCSKGDSIIPINPKVFKDPGLCEGDILISKDSNVGECAIVEKRFCENHMYSGGVVRLHPSIDRYYFLSFIKHPLFKSQLMSMIAPGSTISHAKTLWLDCLIPFPNQNDADEVICYVSSLMQAIVEKEIALLNKDYQIDLEIMQEIGLEQKVRNRFVFNFPTYNDVREIGRLDTGLYERRFKETMFELTNYKHGTGQLADFGLASRRGPNLAVSVSGNSVYRESSAPNHYYRLILPEHISEVRTITKEMWLGNPRRLEHVRYGDILFSARGDIGRTVVIVEDLGKATTNFDGILINSKDKVDLTRNIYIGLMLDYYRRMGILEAIGHGSGAASFTSAHIESLPFPKFPNHKQAKIARLYHNPSTQPQDILKLNNFVAWHRNWNTYLGIWELNREMKALKDTLRSVQEKIIEGNTVVVPS